LVVSLKEFGHYYSDRHLKQILLDAAHDAMPFYLYFAPSGIIPFIDLNQRKTRHKKY
jgi:hypothetical protein